MNIFTNYSKAVHDANKNLKLINVFHKRGRLYLRVDNTRFHVIKDRRADTLKYFPLYCSKRVKRLYHVQAVLNKRYGKNVYTVINYINESHPLVVRHNTPACGYHISYVTPEAIWYKQSMPCKWCRPSFDHTTACIVFKIGKITNGQYTMITWKVGREGNVFVKLRHNSQVCNYNEYWVSLSKFISGTRCPVCVRKMNGRHRQLTSRDVMIKALSRKDNDLQYIPVVKTFRSYKKPMLWWHMTLPYPHLFRMSFNNFITNNAKCPLKKMSNPEKEAYRWLVKHINDSFIWYGYVIRHGLLANYHYDFYLKPLHIAVEIQGGYHAIPTKYGHTFTVKSIRKRKSEDMDKILYSPLYHVRLIHIIAYKWGHYHHGDGIPFPQPVEGKQLHHLIYTQMNKKVLPLIKAYSK